MAKHRKFKFTFLLFIFFSILICRFSTRVFSSDSIKSLEILSAKSKLNKHLEKLEHSLKRDSYKVSCYESKEALKVINSNLNELMIEEPYYHWNEIKELLTKISLDTCN